jgi:hypothetical protein
MNRQDQEPGYSRKRITQDERTREQRRKYDLPEDASLEETEIVAKTLLSNPLTLIEGTELVLGRRVDAKELACDDGESILPLVGQLQSGKDRFGALLMQVDIERRKSEAKK